jgi:two-component system, LytTR family, sensor kinase
LLRAQTDDKSKSMQSYQLWRSGVSFAILGWAAATVFHSVVAWSEFGGHKPLEYMLYANGVRYALWTVTLPLLVRCVERFPVHHGNGVRNGVVLLLIVAGLAPLVSLTWATIIYSTWFPYRSSYPTWSAFVTTYRGKSVQGDLLICVALVGVLQVWRVWQDLQAARTRATDLERQLAVSRLDALRMQLHPHFLFNSLHTIASLIGDQPNTARRMVVALGDFLRLTLKDGNGPVRSLGQELEFTDLYMSIEKLRLGERLILDYDIEPQATKAEVPQLLLQPLFENAVRHGASRISGTCKISFRAHRENGRLNLSLENDGPQISAPADVSKNGVGLSNTTARLRLHYRDDFTLQYTDRPQGGARVEVSLPYRWPSRAQEIT